VRAAPRFLDTLLSLAICVCLSVWVGIVAFANTGEGWAHFSTWWDGLDSLWTLFTTANFPDVMLPAVRENKMSFWFFFVYIVVSLFVLNNVVLAAVYGAYKTELRNGLSAFHEKRAIAIRHAFDLLADSSGEVSVSRWGAFFRAHFQSSVGDLVDPSLLSYNNDRSLAIFRVMDHDQSNGLSLEQFRMIVEAILDDKIYIPTRPPPLIARGRVARTVRGLIMGGKTVCGVLIRWDTMVDVIIFANMLVLLAQTAVFVSPLFGGRFVPHPLEPYQGFSYALFGFSFLYAIETAMRLAVLGFERFWHNHPYQYRFDLITVFALFVMEVALLTGMRSQWFMQALVLVRLTRGCRIVRHVRRMHSLACVIVRLVPIYRNLGLFLFLIYYIYATVGVQVFGGRIYHGAGALEGSDYEKQGYWDLNFNDIPSGMMTLFALMVVNNWYIIAEAFYRVTGTRWSAVFFVSFFVVVNLIVLNILVTLILECFTTVHDDGQSEMQSAASQDSMEGDAPGRMRSTPDRRLPAVNQEEVLLRRLLLVGPAEGQDMFFLAPERTPARILT